MLPFLQSPSLSSSPLDSYISNNLFGLQEHKSICSGSIFRHLCSRDIYKLFSKKARGFSDHYLLLAGYVFSSSPFLRTFSIVFYHSKSVFMFCLVSLVSTGLNRSEKGSSQERRERRGWGQPSCVLTGFIPGQLDNGFNRVFNWVNLSYSFYYFWVLD